MRTDLIERVFRFTRDPGFQEEKYRSLFVQLRWTEEQLTQVLNARVGFLVRQSYTKEAVSAADVLPARINGEDTVKYMLRRTLMRPRELIEFFNECILRSEGRAMISKAVLLDAEGTYSKLRLRSLQDEWVADYPSLLDLADLLRKRPSSFRLSNLDDETADEFCLNYTIDHPERVDALSLAVRQMAEGGLARTAFLASLAHVFYRTGIVGLKTTTSERVQWSHVGTETIPASTIDPTTRVEIHPTFWRVLGVHPKA